MYRIDSYLVFDFETAGLSPASCRIIQVGICRVVGNQIVETTCWLVNQQVPIDPDAEIRHHISFEKTARDGNSPKDSLDRLLAAMKESPTCVGHNVHRFDLQFLRTECRRLGGIMPADEDYIDTAALYKGWQIGRRKTPQESHRTYSDRVLSERVRGLQYSIPVCLQRLGIRLDASKLHDASHDAVATHLIFQALKSKLL